jgi:hypothetical protein
VRPHLKHVCLHSARVPTSVKQLVLRESRREAEDAAHRRVAPRAEQPAMYLVALERI